VPGAHPNQCWEGLGTEMNGISKVLGNWRLIQWPIKEENGSINYPLGEDTIGQLMYGPDGRMDDHAADESG
jgi:hypothetical protein